MLEKLIGMVETVSSRRGFIGRGSAKVTALMAGILGFTRLAEGACLQFGCCCLCKNPTTNCQNDCAAMSGSAFWYWCCTQNGSSTKAKASSKEKGDYEKEVYKERL